MNKSRIYFAQLVSTLVISFHAGCSAGEQTTLGHNVLEHMNSEKGDEVRQAITEELSVGSEAQRIEAFFERHGITYSYDRFNQSYNGIIRNVSPIFDQAILIQIFVDEQRRLTRAEVEDSFTAP